MNNQKITLPYYGGVIFMDAETMLNEIRRTTDMGIVGIEAVEDKAAQRLLQDVLWQQKQEYRELYNSADCLLLQKGGRRKDANAVSKRMAAAGSAVKLMRDRSDSKIAEMMIEGNTKGMIKSYQNIRAMEPFDRETMQLSRKMLETELHNIEQMKKFL